MKTIIAILFLILSLTGFAQHHMMSVLASQSTGPTVVLITTTGASTWTCPAGVTSVTVECWGAGGNGGAAIGYPACGGGGAGGAYARSILTVTPSTVYNVNVGNAGTSTWFNSNTVINAQGGAGGGTATSNSSNGNGGIGSSSLTIGDVKYAGGNGYAGSYSTPRSGSGGGAAGTAQAGGAATASAGGTGYCDISTNTGNGRNGRTTVGAGAAGFIYGGGGAGGYATSATDRAGGAGGQGAIRITY